MPAFSISPEAAKALRTLARRYQGQMVLGKPWYKRDEDELWRKVLGQIIVVGSARAGYTLDRSYEARKAVSVRLLKAQRSEQALKRHLNGVLRAIGTRYVSSNWKSDKKTTAAVYNFRVLMEAGGPKRFFKQVAALSGEPKRIEFLCEHLAYYREKGARDTLIDLGLARDCLALDARIQKLLAKLGTRIKSPIGRHYERIERELLLKVARPCGLTGAMLDRILFQNYDYILADIRLKLRPLLAE